MTPPNRQKRRAKRVDAPRRVAGPMGESYRFVDNRLEVSSGGSWVPAATVPVSLVPTLDDLMKNPTETVDPLQQALAAAGLFPAEIETNVDEIRDAVIGSASIDELVDELKERGAREFGSANMASNALGSQSRRVIAL